MIRVDRPNGFGGGLKAPGPWRSIARQQARAIATYLVVPVLVARDVGPIDAVKESAALLKKTWGENVIGQVGLGAAFAFIFIGVILCSIVVIALAALTHSIFLIVVALVLAVLAIGITGLVQSALTGIYAAALYRYATSGEGTQGFDAQAMQLAFTPKK
jgi:VIT1/CCC1 family predicted Fe2+/Mn2+ transporter